MSIYVVYLPSWYPKTSRKIDNSIPVEEQKRLHENAKMMVEYSSCEKCKKKVRWKQAWGHHSVPWGEWRYLSW